MLKILILTGALALSALGQDWKPLFDGKTLAGWQQVGDGQWVVEDGAIVGKTQQAAKLYGLLVSDRVFHDFSVRLKFKSIKGNSGFYIRTVIESPDKAHGLQIEVDPRKDSGGIYESYGRAWIAKPDPEAFARYFKTDDWNDLLVSAQGGNVTVSVNGTISAHLKDDPSRPAGQLALQMHAGNEMLVMFKDIEVLAPDRKGPDKKGPTSPQVVKPEKDGSIRLMARYCDLTGKSLAFMPEWDALGFWRAGENATWQVETTAPATYDVVMEWSVDPKHAGNPFVLGVGNKQLEAKVESSGRWDIFRRAKIGQLELAAGTQMVALKPVGEFKTALMDLREIRLIPRKQSAAPR